MGFIRKNLRDFNAFFDGVDRFFRCEGWRIGAQMTPGVSGRLSAIMGATFPRVDESSNDANRAHFGVGGHAVLVIPTLRLGTLHEKGARGFCAV